jgi:hypothetical protein
MKTGLLNDFPANTYRKMQRCKAKQSKAKDGRINPNPYPFGNPHLPICLIAA